MAYPIDPIAELAATKALMHFKAAQCDELMAENAKLRELMSEGVEVGEALLRYRDNPPIKRAGPIEGTWYEMGEILSIVMDKPEFSNGELLTRLAYLMGVREQRKRNELDTCCVEDYDDGLDEDLDGNWYRYAPPTWTLSCGHTAEGDEAPSRCPTCGAEVVDE